MKITKNSVVTIEWEIFDLDNNLIEKSPTPYSYLQGGYRGIMPMVKEQLYDKTVGDIVDIKLAPADAFGEIDEDLIFVDQLDNLPGKKDDIYVGLLLEVKDRKTGKVRIYRVTDVSDNKAVIDGNHPLAGLHIRFKAAVKDIRPATAKELKRGSVEE